MNWKVPLPQDPSSGHDPYDLHGWPRQDDTRPDTTIEALMRAASGIDPDSSLEDVEELRDAVAECIAKLSEHDQRIINAYFYEGLTYANVGQLMGVRKTQADRLIRSAMRRLRFHMLAHPVISSRVGEGRTFDSEMHRILLGLSPNGIALADDADLALEARLLSSVDPHPETAMRAMGRIAACILEADYVWEFDEFERYAVKLAPRVLTARRFGVEAIYGLALVAHQDYLASTNRREKRRLLRRIVLLAALSEMYEQNAIDLEMET